MARGISTAQLTPLVQYGLFFSTKDVMAFNEQMLLFTVVKIVHEHAHYQKFHSPTGPYAWLVFSSISSLGDTSS